jgi:lysophospholipase L1-like esterase
MPVLLTFGDSNTHGTMPIADENVRGRYGSDVRWPCVAAAQLGDHWTLIEEGLPGRTTLHPDPDMGNHMEGSSGLRIALESHGPIDYMTLFLGVNDLKSQYNMTPKGVADDIGALMDIALSAEMQERHAGFEVLVICPPPILEQGPIADKFVGGRVKSLALPQHYAEVAQTRNLPVMYAGEYIESSPIDGIHFAPEMHLKLGAAVASALKSMSN